MAEDLKQIYSLQEFLFQNRWGSWILKGAKYICGMWSRQVLWRNRAKWQYLQNYLWSQSDGMCTMPRKQSEDCFWKLAVLVRGLQWGKY